MRYGKENQISLLKCLLDTQQKGLFNIKEGCQLCKDKKVCVQIVKILENNEMTPQVTPQEIGEEFIAKHRD